MSHCNILGYFPLVQYNMIVFHPKPTWLPILKLNLQGEFFHWSRPAKILSVELVPPNREKLLSSQRMAKILTKKVKVQVRAGQTLIFLALSQQKVKVWQTLTWTFTFLVGIFAILGELSSFSLLGGTSSILRTFLGGTSEKTHPVWYTSRMF